MNNQTNHRRAWWIALVAICTLVCVTPASAQQSRVRDAGKFFSADAVQQAEQVLAEISSKQHRSVVIETFDAAPVEITDRIGGATGGAAVAEAFKGFTGRQGPKVAADVYFAISREPSHLAWWSRPEMRQAGLSSQALEQISQSMLTSFKARDFDGGLLEGVRQLQARFANPTNPLEQQAGTDRNTAPLPGAGEQPRTAPNSGANPTPNSTPESSGGLFSTGCMGWLIVGVVVMVVITLIRRIFGGRRQHAAYGNPNQPGGYDQGQPGYGGGGGFGRGMAGGILGGMLGGWLGNQTFGQGHQSSGGDPNAGESNDPNAGHPQDSGDTGGGDFGGGDFGGGDSGGGDSGGGDF